MNSVFMNVPNCAFHSVVVAHSVARGRVILTVRDEYAGLLNYIQIAQLLN